MGRAGHRQVAAACYCFFAEGVQVPNKQSSGPEPRAKCMVHDVFWSESLKHIGGVSLDLRHIADLSNNCFKKEVAST